MDTGLLLAFIAASFVLIVIPGPNIAFIIATSLSQGWKTGLVSVAGTSTGMALQLAVTALGVTSLVVFLAAWFEWLRWMGVGYLIYLGFQHWRSGPNDVTTVTIPVDDMRRAFWRGFLVSIVNPKSLLFFAAYFPQFITTNGTLTGQLLLLSLVFLGMAIVIDMIYALCAAKLRSFVRGRWLDRATGSLLIGGGVALALARRG